MEFSFAFFRANFEVPTPYNFPCRN